MTPESGNYYVPPQSAWPIMATLALALLAIGAALQVSGMGGDGWTAVGVLAAGAALLAWTLFRWFADVAAEDRHALYSPQVDRSFRLGMAWFIFSEVMFFAAFFGALFYLRHFAVPWLGGDGDKGVSNMLWPDFVASWPLLQTPDMASFPGAREAMGPWGIPLINTIILVSSSLTLTLAHKALKWNRRAPVIGWMAATLGLGAVFLGLQVYEYAHAYEDLGLTLQAGVYGATFFLLTGFHGAHVTAGATVLAVIWLRLLRGHFSAQRHFGFEAACWYWHFVDVIWLGLFLTVYVL